MKRVFFLLVFIVSNAHGFDYLEHSFFTDSASYEAQLILKNKIQSKRDLAKYYALAIYCPRNWKNDYCRDDYKVAQALINIPEEFKPFSESHSLSLGDISALPDHTDKFGAVKNVPALNKEGLLTIVLDWMLEDEGEADGYVEDVAEDACETDGLVSWEQVKKNQTKKPYIYEDYFKMGARAQIKKGPSDPAGAYSFDNPQYLDMVLKNHHHFGEKAYQTWLGLHQAAIDFSMQSCEELLYHDESCNTFYKQIKKRIELWHKHADPSIKVPLKKIDQNLLSLTFSSLVGLTFEGLAIHFLQDNLAGGHIRTNREALNLEDARYYHDEDGKHGVLAEFTNKKKRTKYISYGDGFLLGKGAGEKIECPNKKTNDKRAISNCHLHKHRTLLQGSTKDSILHWASEGKTIGEYLPTESVKVAGSSINPVSTTISGGTLPTPRPDFSYQSVSISSASDQSTKDLQLGARLNFLSSLGSNAGWLTSFNYGLYQTQGENLRQYHTEFSFGFHWRWAARFLLNAAPYVQAGRKIAGGNKFTEIALGPRLGMTFLPEGWIRLPLDVTLSWKRPYSVYKSNDSYSQHGQWIEISIGLSFM